MILCRNCGHWYTTPEMQQWQGNCDKHPFENDQYSQECEPNYECQCANEGKGDFVDKLAKYRKIGVK